MQRGRGRTWRRARRGAHASSRPRVGEAAAPARAPGAEEGRSPARAGRATPRGSRLRCSAHAPTPLRGVGGDGLAPGRGFGPGVERGGPRGGIGRGGAGNTARSDRL
jgi:hypothetical protein